MEQDQNPNDTLHVYIARDEYDKLRLNIVTDGSTTAMRARDTILRILGTSGRRRRSDKARRRLFKLYDAFTEVDGVKYEVFAVYDDHLYPTYMPKPVDEREPLPPARIFSQVYLSDRVFFSRREYLSRRVYLYVIRPMVFIRMTMEEWKELEEYISDIDRPSGSELWSLMIEMMSEKLEVDPSIKTVDAEFLIVFCRWLGPEPYLPAMDPLKEWRRRGFMVFDTGRHGFYDYIILACRRAPDEVAQTILAHISGWAAMMVTLSGI